MNKMPNVKLYIVELAYNDQKFTITDPNNKRHLQIRTDTAVLWAKENMINMGIQQLLPKDYRAVCWCDADVIFENTNWALDTLKILNGTRDIVQNFSHCVDTNHNNNSMRIFPSFGYQYTQGLQYFHGGSIDFWHPGYCWSATREFIEHSGGLYDLSILGSGDHNISYSLIGRGPSSVHVNTTKMYKASVGKYQERIQHFRLGYTPGVLRHEYHGTKANRRYVERWQILIKWGYKPSVHICKRSDGLLVPTKDCPQGLLDDIMLYFTQRKEDD